MPEPNAFDSPRYLFEDYLVDEAQVAEVQAKLAELAEMREVFDTRGWDRFVELAQKREAEDMRFLETCSLREVANYRARLGWWRWLINLPANIAAETSNAQTRLQELQPPEHEEDT